MNQFKTKAIVLSRIDYGEADRILSLITSDKGIIRAIAKGVRKPKSKLAGGIELFAVNEVALIKGKSELHTLISSRPNRIFEKIVKDINKTMLGYEMLKIIKQTLEDQAGPEFYKLLESSLDILNDPSIIIELADESFLMRLMRLLGHTPNLETDNKGQSLGDHEKFQFNLEEMAFSPKDNGQFTKNHIKILRLLSYNEPRQLLKIRDINSYLGELSQLVKNMSRQYAVQL